MNLRQKQIINILIKKTEYINAKDLATSLSVSLRTIHNDLDTIASSIDDDNVQIVKKPGVGVMLQASSRQRQALLVSFDLSSENTSMLSTRIRRMKILSRLLYRRENTSLNILSEEFLVSKTSIVHDFGYVEEYIKRFNLQLLRDNKGTRIIGDEPDFRKALSDLASEFMNLEIDDFSLEAAFNTRLDLSTYYRLENIFEIDNLNDVEAIIIESEKILGYKINYLSYVNLVTHILVLIKRIKIDNFMSDDDISQIYDKAEQNVQSAAKFISSSIATLFTIVIPVSEISYISQYLICSGIQSNLASLEVQTTYNQYDQATSELVMKTIKYVCDSIGIELSDDSELIYSLLSHYKPMLQRAKYKVKIANPLLREIKAQYSALYSIICLSFEHIFENRIESNEDEIGFITIHFQAALERKIGKKNIYVVCPEGIGFSRLIVNRIQRYIPSVNILGIVAKNQIDTLDLKNADFIISTTPLEDVKIPVMIVSSFISQYDINAINDYMVSNFRSLDNLTLSSLAKVIDSHLYFPGLDCSTKDESLRFITQRLFEQGYVTANYQQSVIDRENILSTDIGKLIAIPHGKCDYIIKNTIAIASLKEPVLWNKNQVSLIFMIVMNMDNPIETKAVLNDLYKVIDSPELIDVFINDLDYAFTSYLKAKLP